MTRLWAIRMRLDVSFPVSVHFVKIEYPADLLFILSLVIEEIILQSDRVPFHIPLEPGKKERRRLHHGTIERNRTVSGLTPPRLLERSPFYSLSRAHLVAIAVTPTARGLAPVPRPQPLLQPDIVGAPFDPPSGHLPVPVPLPHVHQLVLQHPFDLVPDAIMDLVVVAVGVVAIGSVVLQSTSDVDEVGR